VAEPAVTFARSRSKRQTTVEAQQPEWSDPGFIIYEVAECEKNKTTLYFYNAAVDKFSERSTDTEVAGSFMLYG
jgi:hypothetical protein